jgi:hypothetical protein
MDALRAESLSVHFAGGAKSELMSRIKMPLKAVFDKSVAGVKNMFGGQFVLEDPLHTVSVEMDVWWHGLV